MSAEARTRKAGIIALVVLFTIMFFIWYGNKKFQENGNTLQLKVNLMAENHEQAVSRFQKESEEKTVLFEDMKEGRMKASKELEEVRAAIKKKDSIVGVLAYKVSRYEKVIDSLRRANRQPVRKYMPGDLQP